MMNIVAGKQVGTIYYMVKDIHILCAIVKQGVVRTSLKAEPPKQWRKQIS